MRRGNLEHGTALFAGQVSVHRSRDVIDGRVLVEVGVDDDPQLLELFEDPVHGGGADVGLELLDLVGDLVGSLVAGGADQDLGEGPLGHRDPVGRSTDGGEDLLDVGANFVA